MQKIIYIIFVCFSIISCSTYTVEQELYDVPISFTTDELIGEEDTIKVTLTSSISGSYTQNIIGNGSTCFHLPAGIYQVSATGIHEDTHNRTVWNGNMTDLIVGKESMSSAPTNFCVNLYKTTIDLTKNLLIKEIYVGGCQKDDGSGKFVNDKCLIIYNNSAYPTSLDGICIGMIEPYNAEASTHNFLNNGVLDYASESWIPAINGYWYFAEGEILPPYTELVVAMNGAIDHTLTYKNSVNYANNAYYAMYNPEHIGSDGTSYNNKTIYPAPSNVIPQNHLMKAVKYGSGNAWPVSATSPAIILFRIKDTTPSSFASKNIVFPPSRLNNLTYACVKVPREWVLDAVEVYNAQNANCKKRLTPDLDNGSIALTSGYGHSLLRKSHVNEEGKVIYEDTNNSTNDFMEIDKCTLTK